MLLFSPSFSAPTCNVKIYLKTYIVTYDVKTSEKHEISPLYLFIKATANSKNFNYFCFTNNKLCSSLF